MTSTSTISVATDAPTPNAVADLERLIDGWLDRYPSPQTQGAYRNDLRRWSKWCDEHGVPVLQATAAHVAAYRSSPVGGDLASGDAASASTLSRRLASISSFCRHCVAVGAMERNPVEYLRRSRSVARSAIVCLDDNERDRILATAAVGGARDMAIVGLMLIDGLRSSELLGIRTADIELDGAEVRIRVRQDDGASRAVVVSSASAQAVRLLLASNNGIWLFETLAGSRLRRQYVYQVVRRMGRRSGIAKTVSCLSLHETFRTTKEPDSGRANDTTIDMRHIDLSGKMPRRVLDLIAHQDDDLPTAKGA
jgi:site-specific recombinase XerD